MDTFNKHEWKPQKHFVGGSWTQRSTYHYDFIYKKFKYWQNETNVTEIKIVAASSDWLVGDINEPSGLKMFCILFVVVVSSVCTRENALNYLHRIQIYALHSS